MGLSQTHWGLDIELSLFSFLKLGLLTRVGLHVLAVVALSGSVALLLHPHPDPYTHVVPPVLGPGQ